MIDTTLEQELLAHLPALSPKLHARAFGGARA